MRRGRTMGAMAALFLVVAGILLAAAGAAQNPASGWGLLVSVPGAILVVVTVASLYEWMVHRHLYHGRAKTGLLRSIRDVHHVGHHWQRFPPDRYTHRLPVERIPVLPPQPYGVCGTRFRRSLAWWGQFSLYLAIAIPLAFRLAVYTQLALYLFLRRHRTGPVLFVHSGS